MVEKYRNVIFVLFCLFSQIFYSQNLITNGDFGTFDASVPSPVPLGYTSTYTLIPNNVSTTVTAGKYAITNNPRPISPGGLISTFDISNGNFGDGTDNMMFVKGKNNDVFWELNQPGLTLELGKKYLFSFWIKNVHATPSSIARLPIIRLKVSGFPEVTFSNIAGTSTINQGWVKCNYSFFATTTTITIQLSSVNANSFGELFVIDDISLTPPLVPMTASFVKTDPSCPTVNDGSIVTYTNSGISSFAFELTNLAGTIKVNNSTGVFTGLSPDSYIVSVVDSDTPPEKVTSSTLNLVAPTDMTLSSTASGCMAPNSSVTLTASNGVLPYTWSASTEVAIPSTSANPPAVTPAINTTYTVTSSRIIPNTNLITNGDFESINPGFYSDFINTPLSASLTQFDYGITTNPNLWNPAFITTTDRSGSGKMFVAKGATFVNKTIWSQTVLVDNSKTYTFEFFAQNAVSTLPAKFRVLINGIQISISQVSAINSESPGWTRIFGTWNSGTATTSKIQIINTNISLDGNDFAIDDISFSTTAPAKSCLLTKTVDVKVSLTSDFINPPAFCSGSIAPTLPSTSPNGIVGTWSPATINNTTPRSYTFLPTASLDACAIGQTLNTIITSVTNPGTLSGNQNICLGGLDTTFSSTVSGGTWTSSNNSIATVNSTTGVVRGFAVGTVTITYTIIGTGGCANATASRTVTVTTPLTAAILISGIQNVCTGLKTTFSSNIAGGTWSSSDDTIATVNPSTGLVTGVTAGTATITYTIKGIGGCSDVQSTRNVIVIAEPSAGILNGNRNVCVGLSTTFTSTIIGGTWSSGDTSIATVIPTTGVVRGVKAGTVTMIYTVLGTGCSNAISSITVTVNLSPTAGTLKGNQNVCIGLQTTFESSVMGGSWTSSNPLIATIDSETGLITGAAIGTANMTYTVSGSGGCPNASETREVYFSAGSDAGALSGLENVCKGRNTMFSSSISGGTWSSSNNAIATVNSVGEVAGVAEGTAIINYKILGTGGCLDSNASRNIIVSTPPNAGTLSGNQNVCLGLKTTFSSTTTGGTWVSEDPFIATVDATTGEVTGVAAGITTINYTITGIGGCSDAIALRQVTVTAPPPTAILSGTQNICATFTTSFSSDIVGGTWSSSNNAIATVNSIGDVIGFSGGTAIINYKILGTGGCLDSTASRNVIVSTPPNAGTLSGNQNVCLGFSPTFSSTSNGGSWISSDTAIATVNSTTGILTGVSVGTATITYTVLGIDGCPNAFVSRDITFNNDTNAGLLTGNTKLCQGLTIPLLSSISGGTWSSSDNTIATVDVAGVVTGVSAGSVTITYTISPTQGQCVKTSFKDIEVNSSIIPEFNSVSPICYGEVLEPLSLISINGIKGNWSPNLDNLTTKTYTFTPDNDQQCAIKQELIITVKDLPEFQITGECNSKNYELSTNLNSNFSYNWLNAMSESISTTNSTIVTKNGNYSLQVVSDGCKKMKEYEVKNVSCNYPKGISPNNDEYNNFFDLENFKVKLLQIYNRFGQEVYSKNNYINEWSGLSSDGKELPDGTYFYVITLLNNDKPDTGWVYINR